MSIFKRNKRSYWYCFNFVLLSSLLLQQCVSTNTVHQDDKNSELKVVRQAAEFEKQKGLILIWPPFDHLEGKSNSEVTLEILKNVAPHTPITVTCATDSIRLIAEKRIQEVLPNLDINVKTIPSVEIWARDMGPNFVETNDGKQAIADFNFDAWGYADTLDADAIVEEKFDEKIAELYDLPIISSSLVSEGGDREVNGKGTLLTVETVEFGRNPNLTKEEIESEFQRLLGVSNIVWLKKGLHEDDHTFNGPILTHEGSKAYTVITTNGHIDEFCRFVNDSTILLAQVDSSDLHDPIAMENHKRMEENYEILKSAKDQDGKPFNIVRIPLPKTILATMKPGDGVYDYISTLNYTDGSSFPIGEEVPVIAAASYLNFLITNNVVIAQKYWSEGMDESIKLRDKQALVTLKSVFPNRKVIAIDALAVNLGGGGVHCITMQIPSNKAQAL
ncbi:agmatine deiminase family protein [Sediminitomix flava]|uniref:Agmatine deiminase n=1 Tax=Sediminitomix flava TaxID=379075 RepID=A0A315ZAU0_SEDFL|nr:agmatine deiminase family protein [Sediminitomix flava]PWJ42412.1 agmatine deiminase [Sediminitomix flava]